MKWLVQAKGSSQEKRAAVICWRPALRAAAGGCAHLVGRPELGANSLCCTQVSMLGHLGLNPNFTA